jgi:anti-anti-sigma factor
MTATENTKPFAGLKLDHNPDLKLTLEETGINGAVIIRLGGLIDNFNSEFLRLQASRVIDAGYQNIIIDASGTLYMSSTGIGAFTYLLKQVRQKRGSMIIFGMPAKIFDVFKLLGFSTFFQFCSSREEAISLLGVNKLMTPVFPIIITCPACGRRLKAVQAGRFRCSSCRVVIRVISTGDVTLA